MRIERLLTAAILALLLLGAIAVQSGLLPLGPLASKAIQISSNLKVPVLDDPAIIQRGAAHYEIVCAGCHASPAAPNQANHLRLTPPAPRLHLRSDDWLPEVVFLTVKHGVPNTAMPAWPAQGRDDEVWSMVAFLQVLPDLDAASYTALARRDAGAGRGAASLCSRCHGATGQGDGAGAFPRLDIQSADYLLSSLQAYRDGTRQSGFMTGIAGALGNAEMLQLSQFFAGHQLDAPPVAGPSLVTNGDLARHLPACSGCHGTADPGRAAFPSLYGQSADYLAAQLRLFAQDPFTRGGGPFVDLMRQVSQGLTEADILAVAEWYAHTATPKAAD